MHMYTSLIPISLSIITYSQGQTPHAVAPVNPVWPAVQNKYAVAMDVAAIPTNVAAKHAAKPVPRAVLALDLTRVASIYRHNAVEVFVVQIAKIVVVMCAVI